MTVKDTRISCTAELRQRAEELALRKKARAAEAISPEETRRMLHELQVHQIELEMQNEELLRIQLELERMRARYFDLYDLAPVGYCTFSEKNLILEANLTAANLLGVSRGALAGQRISRFIATDDQDIYYHHRNKLLTTGERQICELRMVKNDGTAFWAHLVAIVAGDHATSSGQEEDEERTFRVVLSDISAFKEAEGRLRESELNYMTLINSGMALIWTSGADRLCNYFNSVWLAFTGRTLEQELAGGWSEGVHPDDLQRCMDIYSQAFDRREKFSREYRLRRYDGAYRWMVDEGCPRYDSRGRFTGYIGHCLDIEERRRAEDERVKLEIRLRQAEKMESIGLLAGGVAHEFNNKLAIILGYAEKVLNEVEPAGEIFADLEEIRKAAEHSADLTRQLLAFARQQMVQPEVLHLNETVAKMLTILRRLIGDNIVVSWLPATGLWLVKMDPSQFRQILTELFVNAREAMAGTGRLTITTANCVVDETCCAAHPGFVRGEYVLLTVIDTGCGMDKETRAKVFEPFFTTKALCEGAGLGLAAMYGAIKQNNGFIDISSQPGAGTTFNIYLPRYKETDYRVQP